MTAVSMNIDRDLPIIGDKMSTSEAIYVDVDDTFVRTYGEKRIVIPHMIDYIRNQAKSGKTMYCWSSGGAAYARESAFEFGIADCFAGFLPKPSILIDDQRIADWRGLRELHPRECGTGESES